MKSYYPKINTIFKRDMNPGKFHNCIMPSEGFTQPEFEYLRGCNFECTEKIDGTSMSVHLVPDDCVLIKEETSGNTGQAQDKYRITYRMEIHGKTENSNIPQHLLDKMNSMFSLESLVAAFNKDKIYNTFDDALNEMRFGRSIIFGEGYGVKIQKGGNYISNDCDFIVFDVKVGDIWLLRESVVNIAEKLQLKTVPLIGYMTVDEAIDFVKKGFKSTISENRDYDAEGLVLKSPIGLLNRNGERIITKIKTCDFRQLEARERSIKD